MSKKLKALSILTQAQTETKQTILFFFLKIYFSL